MKKGIIIRHLILPNNLANTKKVIDYDIMDDLVFKFDVSKKLQADFYKIKAKNLLFKIINKNILYWFTL